MRERNVPGGRVRWWRGRRSRLRGRRRRRRRRGRRRWIERALWGIRDGPGCGGRATAVGVLGVVVVGGHARRTRVAPETLAERAAAATGGRASRRRLWARGEGDGLAVAPAGAGARRRIGDQGAGPARLSLDVVPPGRVAARAWAAGLDCLPVVGLSGKIIDGRAEVAPGPPEVVVVYRSQTRSALDLAKSLVKVTFLNGDRSLPVRSR